MAADTSPSNWDWHNVDLVVFDVDGTLYDQKRLRLRMGAAILAHAAATRSRRTIRIISRYRRLREEMGEQEVDGFEPILVERTARAIGCSTAQVHRAIDEWMNERPLRYLQACRFAGLQEVFAALDRRGKTVGILSDYPVAAKLEALGLRANHAVFAGQEEVGILKPHPRGLLTLMERAGATPDRTVLVGDRIERDGIAARRAGTHSLIKTKRPIEGWRTFRDFGSAPFDTLLRDG